MTFGNKLAALRREQNYTQEQLAELLGVSRQSVSKWESDAAYPETEKLIRLSDLFGCSLDYLLRDAPKAPAQETVPAPAAVTVQFPYFERKSKRTVRGVPLWHVNIGPFRVAHGIFALGLTAKGVVSAGLFSAGVVSVGICSLGVLALGSIAVGLVSFGAVALGLLAFGAVAFGVFACGGAAIGLFSVGAEASARFAALGDYAQGRIAVGKTQAEGALFSHLGSLSPQDRAKLLVLLDEITPVGLRWAAALFKLFL